MTSGPDGGSKSGSASGGGGAERLAAGSRRSHVSRCMPAVTGPVNRRSARLLPPVTVTTTPGASSSSPARNSSREGQPTGAFFFSASFSASCRFSLRVFNASFKYHVTVAPNRSEEHTSELQSHSFISYAVFCLKKKKK